ncbi:putative H-N-H-endonuclease P-TflVIII [Escherichia phage DT57C]|uniref:Putative H-N-H-endonuclease P-TflVIII n=2 Tax=Tequintavirus TaxID=187218 RepID=A0A0A7RSW9_9CAUD|nr:HNH endonuclease [Escherichia phage DT57C]YP_009784924.1 HNH endonuclease [Escherichia phage DT571/2]AJA41594.1 putative H-N-H-endonuclease P-TflVIII [Escherichia phage DT57C]AJA41725.1 putative H-N-H-endonuclease P-TflVIII [Escherichia phage DT571/2]
MYRKAIFCAGYFLPLICITKSFRLGSTECGFKQPAGSPLTLLCTSWLFNQVNVPSSGLYSRILFNSSCVIKTNLLN